MILIWGQITMADQVIDRQLAPINKPIKHNYCNFS